MTFHIEAGDLAKVDMLPQVREACEIGARLVALWPLKEALQLANDVRYCETLQVRVIRSVAQLLIQNEVPVADAEFVYDGALSIPGRPQEEVDTLLNVVEGWEQMSNYSETGETTQIMAGAGDLKVDWDEATVTRFSEALETIEATIVTARDQACGKGAAEEGVESMSQRFSLLVVVCAGLLDILTATDAVPGERISVASLSRDTTTGTATVDGQSVALGYEGFPNPSLMRRCAPLPLYINELCERISMPRLVVQPADLISLLSVRTDESGAALNTGIDNVEAVADILAPLGAREWSRHYDELLFDPDAAKQEAKEKEEKAKKARLAAKFADIPEDPNKKPVEL